MTNSLRDGNKKQKMLATVQSYEPSILISGLLNSIDNSINGELRIALEQKQTNLILLGIHSVALTISEAFFNKTSLDGYKMFLEKFVDGTSLDKQFSKIAHVIHSLRNIIAHQWIGSTEYEIIFDYEMDLGYEVQGDKIVINPKIYCNLYLSAFSQVGIIWEYDSTLSSQELEKIKARIVKKIL